MSKKSKNSPYSLRVSTGFKKYFSSSFLYKLYHNQKDNHQVPKIIRVPGNKANPKKRKEKIYK